MKRLATALMLAMLLLPGAAWAGSSTDAALALGSFAVLNQIIGGTGIFAGLAPAAPHPVYYAPPPPAVYVAPPPPVYVVPPPPVYVVPRPIYVAPQSVYVAPRPVYVGPRPVVVYPRPASAYARAHGFNPPGRHWKH